MRTSRSKVLAALAAAIISIVTATLWHGSSAANADSQVTTTAQYPALGAVPADTMKGLQGLYVDVTGAATSAAAPNTAVPLSTAVDLARAAAGRQDTPVSQITASLATVTTEQFGVELQPDPSKPSSIQPAIDHALTWVITFQQVPEHDISGRRGATPAFDPNAHLGTVVVFLSPVTGQVLYGLSF